MANQQHLDILTKQGVDAWNQWRKDNPGITPDLSGANLQRANPNGANFRYTDLSGVNFQRANLSQVNFGHADLSGADLWYTDLSGFLCSHAKITGTKWPNGGALEWALFQDAKP